MREIYAENLKRLIRTAFETLNAEQMDRVCTMIDWQPDIRPDEHAHWIDKGKYVDPRHPEYHLWVCSNCNHDDVCDKPMEYCWSCGFKMDEKTGNQLSGNPE